MLRTAVKWVSDPNNPQPAVLGAGGVSLELAPAALRQSRALIRHPLRAAGATRRGGLAPNNHTGHRCARPGVPARGACAREEGPSAAMARVVCGCSTPCWLRLRRGACGVRRITHCAPAALRSDKRGESVHKACALRRACPPRKRPDAGLPLRTAKGSQTAGSPFFWVLFFGEAKNKYLARRGETRPPPSPSLSLIHISEPTRPY